MKHKQALRVQSSFKRIYAGAIMLVLLLLLTGSTQLMAQCALCTKTAQQLGDGPAAGLNKGILYLMVIPISILSIIGVKWYKKEKITRALEDGEQGGK